MKLIPHKAKWRWTVCVIAIAIGFGTLSMCSYSSGSLQGQVLDAGTKVPLSDVVVLATWTVTGDEGYPIRVMATFEVLTDDHGIFNLPAWGPRFNFEPLASVRHDQPMLLFLRRGYEPLTIYRGNRRSTVSTGAEIVDREANVFALKRFDGTLEEYSQLLVPLTSRLSLINLKRCEWVRMPILLMQLEALRKQLEGTSSPLGVPSLAEIVASPMCSAHRAYLRSLSHEGP